MITSGGLARNATSSATADHDGGADRRSRRASWTSSRTRS